ncbi:MAG: GTP-binding protein [Gammaproteobacteria bacterium]|nr:GTP-binding protein [Gammaproteobacteria bacterium]
MSVERSGKDIKMIVVGDSGVGKTCIIGRMAGRGFDSGASSTVACSFSSVAVKITTESGSELERSLQIWDTAGQERYASLIKSFFRNSNISLLVFDVGRKDTFEHLAVWLARVREGDASGGGSKIFVIGNKTDILDGQDYRFRKDVVSFCNDNGLYFLGECSAKTNSFQFYKNDGYESGIELVESLYIDLVKIYWSDVPKDLEKAGLEVVEVGQGGSYSSGSGCCM